jgi:UDP:flavonoid glycosyltransferase YjiC (YdhE family)
MNKPSLPALNATRASIGARPFKTADEMFNVAPMLLYMTAEPFEYPRSDWPAAVRMVGPCCWEPPSEPPAWLDEITRPLVLVTTSSEFQDDGRLVRTALDALADEDVQVVATLPAATLDMQTPANARVETFISHGPLLRLSVRSPTEQAQQKAPPACYVCVVPFGRDQPVARRVSGERGTLPVKCAERLLSLASQT